jgi:hypothetical protein
MMPVKKMTLEEMNAEQARMKKAFALVSPDREGRHWKDRIDARITSEECRAAGVSLEEVCESVEYMTGTPAKALVTGVGRYHVTAPGYWAGPCN